MGTDYTVIQAVRQRFGDSPGGNLNSPGRDQDELPIEAEAPFVGKSKDFPFTCHSVDRSQMAVLQFNTLAVSGLDVIQINGVDIAGGISIGGYLPWFDPKMPFWSTHHLLVDGNVLAEDNVLHIEAGAAGAAGGGIGTDDFILDNVVIWFKTVPSGRPSIEPTRKG